MRAARIAYASTEHSVYFSDDLQSRPYGDGFERCWSQVALISLVPVVPPARFTIRFAFRFRYPGSST